MWRAPSIPYSKFPNYLHNASFKTYYILTQASTVSFKTYYLHKHQCFVQNLLLTQAPMLRSKLTTYTSINVSFKTYYLHKHQCFVQNLLLTQAPMLCSKPTILTQAPTLRSKPTTYTSANANLLLTQASMFAPLSSFGSASMLTTDSRIFSMLCTGLHLSAAVSYPRGSSPGVWRIEIQTRPSGYTTQWWKFIATHTVRQCNLLMLRTSNIHSTLVTQVSAMHMCASFHRRHKRYF